ncbi:hypothetical protein GALMADRAFT_251334 [Galerina marginata CBS 339.88]|uniref:Uncharacterized protein n=1 Tax=Galerina marginata (strain CBS 339.88) TaxID=685588 RepID=A0A067T0Y9_GALM3|nr:hypothetical protein GALMADRAFT_251334 [Galerina marginata CBS 339.88]
MTPKVTFDDATRQQPSREYRGSFYKDASLSEEQASDDDAHPDSDSDDPIFHWDEEATLLSDLMEDGPTQNEDQHLDALVDSLQASFTDQGKLMKKEIAETLVPTHNHVKTVFQRLDKQVDTFYGQGISLFNTACKDIENTMYAQQVDFNEMHEKALAKIDKLLGELEAEYAQRDGLWIQLTESVNEIVTPVLSTIKDTPAKIERTVIKLEKHARTLENGSKDLNSVNKGLQDLLKGT